MLDAIPIVRELYEMAEAPADKILHRAVERIHEAGSPFDWVGIYLLNRDQLVLHSYIGRATDLLRIRVGEGVCGKAIEEGRDMNVPDVDAVDHYLACSPDTRSEIVVLIRAGERIIGEIDVDSDTPAAFAEHEEEQLRRIADVIGELIGPRLPHNG